MEERRKDDERISSLQQSVARIEANIISVKDARDVSDRWTYSFRQELKETLSSLSTKLSELPCEARSVEIINIKSTQNVLFKKIDTVWVFIILVFITYGAFIFFGGRWVGAIETDVDSLKKTSYGYNDAKVIHGERNKI